MAAKEQENPNNELANETHGMTKCHSKKFGFTVWYLTSENKVLSKVIVINEASERLELLENHLKTVNCEREDVGKNLVEKAEKIFSKINQNKDSQENVKTGKNTVCQYFLQGKCRFGDQCFNSHNCQNGTVESCQNGHGIGENNNADHHLQTKSNKKKKLSISLSTEKQIKKSSMKTATDVINRIQWDKKLNPENFTVGYLDRFLGVIENSFSFFNWEDITSVDETALAIPRHRIQYFKYQDQIVWDKRKRLDNMFGSTGSGQTILDIINKLRQQNIVEQS